MIFSGNNLILGLRIFCSVLWVLGHSQGKILYAETGEKKKSDYREYIHPQWKTIPGITVLCYHQVYTNKKSSAAKHNFNISKDNFRAQLEYLKRNNYQSISLPVMYQYISTGAYPPDISGKPVVISFDDGTAIFKKAAQPLLKEFGYTETHFIAMGLIDKVAGHMKTRQLKQTIDGGAYVESHGYRHFLMSDFAARDRARDIIKSRTSLAKITSMPIMHMAYPQGIYTDDMLAQLEQTNFDAAYTVYHGENIPGNNRAYLNRYLVLQSHGLEGFIERLETRTLPVIGVTPERGARVKTGSQVSFSLPHDIDLSALKIQLDNKLLSSSDYEIVNQAQMNRVTMKFARPRLKRIFREVKLDYTEGGKKYHHTLLFLKK